MTHEGVDAMGRGRQKAKQTKVARELKYFSPDTDYDALQRELGQGADHTAVDRSDAQDLEDDPYGSDGSYEDNYDSWAAGQNR
jgi:hypothetical protein